MIGPLWAPCCSGHSHGDVDTGSGLPQKYRVPRDPPAALLLDPWLRHFSSSSHSFALLQNLSPNRSGGAISRRRVFMLCRAFRLLSRQDCTEALSRSLRAVCAASMALFWESWPLAASSSRCVIGPTASSIRACCFASCLSRDFVVAGSLPLMTLSRLGQAVAGVFGVPYLSHHWCQVELGSTLANADARNFSVFSPILKSLTPFESS